MSSKISKRNIFTWIILSLAVMKWIVSNICAGHLYIVQYYFTYNLYWPSNNVRTLSHHHFRRKRWYEISKSIHGKSIYLLKYKFKSLSFVDVDKKYSSKVDLFYSLPLTQVFYHADIKRHEEHIIFAICCGSYLRDRCFRNGSSSGRGQWSCDSVISTLYGNVSFSEAYHRG